MSLFEEYERQITERKSANEFDTTYADDYGEYPDANYDDAWLTE